MSERLLTYDEMTVVLRRSAEGVRQLTKRKRWRRVLGNDGRARIAVPLEFIEASTQVDAPPTAPADMATTPVLTPPPTPAPDCPVEPEATASTGDARALVELLHSRIEELSADLRQARAEIAELAAKSGRVDVVESLLIERDRRITDLEVDRDRWHAAATARRRWWPWRRGA
jgi:hypothetical protein